MSFKHGISTKELESNEKVYLASKSPIVVIGAAPINMGDLKCIDTPVLIQNETDAAKYFGGVNNIKGFNISETLYTAFQLFGVAPIICINVLDPTKHGEVHAFENLIVKNKKVVIEHLGAIPAELRLTNAEGTAINGDAIETSFNSKGQLEILLEVDTATVSGSVKVLNPALIQPGDIIGGVDITTLKRKGLEAIEDIFSKYSMIPGIGISPGFTDNNEIRTIMNTKFENVNSKWKSIIIADIPETTPYGDAIKWKKENNAIDPEQLLTYGKGVIGNQLIHLSTLIACELKRGDSLNDGVPCDSPSNKSAKVSKIVYKNSEGVYEDVVLDEVQGNLLNENGIITAINTPGGFMFWGNRTSAFQPGGTGEKKDIWIHAKRMTQYLCNTIAINNQSEVDKRMPKSRAIAIRDNINQFLGTLISKERLLGGRVEFRQEDNPGQSIAGGKFEWLITVGDVPIGEDLRFNVLNSSEFAVEIYKI